MAGGGAAGGDGAGGALRPPSSALADGVIGGLGCGLQGLLGGGSVVQGRGGVRRALPQDGRQVPLGLVAVRQLQEAGEAVQVGQLVEGAQQEVHHHEAHEQVDCSRGRGERNNVRGVYVLFSGVLLRPNRTL